MVVAVVRELLRGWWGVNALYNTGDESAEYEGQKMSQAEQGTEPVDSWLR